MTRWSRDPHSMMPTVQAFDESSRLLEEAKRHSSPRQRSLPRRPTARGGAASFGGCGRPGQMRSRCLRRSGTQFAGGFGSTRNRPPARQQRVNGHIADSAAIVRATEQIASLAIALAKVNRIRVNPTAIGIRWPPRRIGLRRIRDAAPRFCAMNCRPPKPRWQP